MRDPTAMILPCLYLQSNKTLAPEKSFTKPVFRYVLWGVGL